MSDELIEAVAKEIASADGWATTGSTIADYMPLARAALTAIEAAGFAIVPVEPTSDMLAHGDSALPRFEKDTETSFRMMGVDGAFLCWTAMLAARPKVTG